jgi:hypothetical protein
MLWKEIKSWCKKNGYKTDRSAVKEQDNHLYTYTWYKIDNPEINGITTSVSKLAAIIYNQITENKWTEYQNEYKEKITNIENNHGQEFGFQ